MAKNPGAPPMSWREIGAHLVHPLTRTASPFAGNKRSAPITPRLGRNLCPKLPQLVGACLRQIAGNQGPIDGADRDAGNPVGVKIGLGQGFIGKLAGLVDTERAAPLQEERDALERRARPGGRIAG